MLLNFKENMSFGWFGRLQFKVNFKVLVIFLITFGFSLSASLAGNQPETSSLNLMPYPAKVELAPGQFRLSEKFYIGGEAQPGHRVFKAASRFMSRLSGRTGLFLNRIIWLARQSLTRPDCSIILNNLAGLSRVKMNRTSKN